MTQLPWTFHFKRRVTCQRPASSRLLISPPRPLLHTFHSFAVSLCVSHFIRHHHLLLVVPPPPRLALSPSLSTSSLPSRRDLLTAHQLHADSSSMFQLRLARLCLRHFLSLLIAPQQTEGRTDGRRWARSSLSTGCFYSLCSSPCERCEVFTSEETSHLVRWWLRCLMETTIIRLIEGENITTLHTHTHTPPSSRMIFILHIPPSPHPELSPHDSAAAP